MTSPLPPADFLLTRDWWESGSAHYTKTLYDVLAALDVAEEPNPYVQVQAVHKFYREHKDLRRYIPEAVRQELAAHGFVLP